MNEPIGRFGSCKPARARRTAVETEWTAFEHAVDRDAGPARHHLRHVIGGHRFFGHNI
jgi:hypothetical protein